MINLEGKSSRVATKISDQEFGEKVEVGELPVFLQEEIGLGEHSWRFYKWPKEDPLIIAENGYDLAEANVDVETINLKEVKSVSFMGGNFFTHYKRKDKSKPGFVTMTNYEEGAILIEY